MKHLLTLSIVITTLVMIITGFKFPLSNSSSKNLPEGYVNIPEGAVIIRTNYDDSRPVIMDSTEAFYIASAEVSNSQYIEFLGDLKATGKLDEYHKNLPDTTVWRDLLAYNEPYVMYYFRHDAYMNYPVVGVSKVQAQNYAAWKTKKHKEAHPLSNISFQLPTKKQWKRAARGANNYRYSNGAYLRGDANEKDRRMRYKFLYNFKYTGPEAVHRDEESRKYSVVYVGLGQLEDDGALITTQVKSYWPNEFGVYNMCGNVAELVEDDSVAMGGSWNDPGFDVRVESMQNANKPTSTIGFRLIAVSK